MKQINHRGYLLVEVSETAYDMAIQGKTLTGAKKTGAILWFRDLPPGQWEIIGKGNEIEENAVAKNALYELIKSHGMKPECTIILKLKNNVNK